MIIIIIVLSSVFPCALGFDSSRGLVGASGMLLELTWSEFLRQYALTVATHVSRLVRYAGGNGCANYGKK